MKIIVKALCYLLCLSSFIANAQEAGVTRYGEVSTVKNKEYIDRYGRISPCPQLTRYGKIIRYTANMDTLLYGLNGAGALTVSIHVTSAENADSVGFECATDQNFTDIVALKNHISVDTITYKDTFNTLPQGGPFYLRAYIANCPGVVYCDTVKIDFESVTDTITFIANGGSGTMSTQTVTRGVATAIKSNAYTHDGNWNFTGWSDDCDGNGNAYADNASITTSGNVTLYAQWHTWCTGTPAANESGSTLIDSVQDHQDNWYKVVQIGNQCWLKENLKTTTSIGNSYYPGTGYGDDKQDSVDNVPTYGLLYDWKAAMQGSASTNYPAEGDKVRGICPEGWHVPSKAEWDTLTYYVYNSTDPDYKCPGCDAGSDWEVDTKCIAKALSGISGWKDNGVPCNVGYAQENNNATGFSAVPAGQYFDMIMSNAAFGDAVYFWSATEKTSSDGYSLCWFSNYSKVHFAGNDKADGYSVRCVRDN